MSRTIIEDINANISKLKDSVKRIKYYLDELDFNEEESHLSDNPVNDLLTEFDGAVVKLPTRLRVVDVSEKE